MFEADYQRWGNRALTQNPPALSVEEVAMVAFQR